MGNNQGRLFGPKKFQLAGMTPMILVSEVVFQIPLMTWIDQVIVVS